MDRLDTFRILARAADWDAAAPTPRIEARQSPTAAGIREDAARAITRVKRLGGGSTPILKILLSNACSYHCAYCVNRCSASIPRATFKPEELARTISEFTQRGWIQGAFISSGVLVTPDETMERLAWTAHLLREAYDYRGYLHLKIIPGTSPDLIRQASIYATRVSVNIELPTEESLRRLAPEKSPDTILGPMQTIAGLDHLSGGQTTQLIVGATSESDAVILRLAQHLYHSFNVRRVYYSAFRPEGTDPSLPRPAQPPVRRELRLYQADMLFLWYHFEPSELFESQEFLDEDIDPKTSWALRHPECFPVELLTSDYEQMLRIPGIDLANARRILALRRSGRLDFDTLCRKNPSARKSAWFITIRGRAPEPDLLDKPEMLRKLLQDSAPSPCPIQNEFDWQN